LFNPAFVNTLSGGIFPLTPGPNAGFVFVRAVNEADETIEFLVTVDREVPDTDDQGNFVVDASGNFLTHTERETVRLRTFPDGRAHELGVLFPCRRVDVTRVGLGENLLSTDAMVFVGAEGPVGAPGFGVPAGDLNPLSAEAGNFACGDTIIFRAFSSTGVTGGVKVQSFVLPYSEQPSEFRADTFVNLEDFLETQVREGDP
jgi:hypothetical protein